eukprot:XP_016656668.1 PREDICTED: uncharacterized protein LOC107882592 [Acyrthosiphon pisum]
MQIETTMLLVVTAAAVVTISLPLLLPVTGIGLPVSRLTYIVSGAHLEWPRPGDRLRATESGEYVARNVVPARMAMRHDGVIYLAMPRLRRGHHRAARVAVPVRGRPPERRAARLRQR